MNQSKNRYISFLLAVVMILTISPMNVFAGNNDTLPSNPSTGQGSSDWKYAEDWEGVRISLYWAPSQQDFIDGTELVRQLGETKDFTKTGPRYKVDEYTTYSIYRYMNGDSVGKGEKYNSELDKFNKYYYVGKEDSSIVANMPAVWNGKKVDWDNWIEGNDYINVSEIARLLGAKVSSEDFVRGNLDIEGYKAKGIYKIFIEPIIYPTVAGKGMVLTLRDAIRWEEAFNRGEIKPEQMKGSSGNLYTPSLTMNLLPIFEYVANSQFLIEDEPAISMTANNSNYRVDGSTGSSARREEIRKQIKPGGKIYSSMGVGVFNSPNVEIEDEAYVVETYVKVVGVNSDGSLKFEEIKPSEVKEAEFDEKGALIIEEIKELEVGKAILNDVITSPKNLIKDANEKLDWTGELPKTNSNQILPIAEDIYRYNLGIVTGMAQVVSELREESSKYEAVRGLYEEYKEIFDALERSRRYDEPQEVIQSFEYVLQEILLEVSNIIGFDTFSFESLDTGLKKLQLEAVLSSMPVDLESFIQKAIYITDLSEVYLDTEPPVEGKVIEGEITIPYGNTQGVIELENFKSGNKETGERAVAYLRYLVFPTRKEVIFEETYKDGILIDRIRTVKDLPLIEVEEGKYEKETYITDMRKTNPNLTLISWGTSKNIPLLEIMPTNPIKSGTQYEPILGLETDENVYVTWRKELFTGNTTSKFLVDEWRLSKYTDNIGFNSQAYMGLSLRADQGHRTSTLSPSGRYNYDTVNPNGKLTDKNYNPENMKYTSYLHSKALTQGNYSISHGSPSVLVDVTGNLNLIKSTDLTGLRIANWTVDSQTKSGLNLHNLEVNDKGVNYSGNTVINKSDTLKYGIKNKDIYTHQYGVYYHYTCYHWNYSHDVCACYTLPETPGVTYDTADYKVDATFERYKPQNTDSRLLKLVNPIEKVENGKTTVAKQESSILNVYPEIPMLFANDKGEESIKFAVGDIARKIQPISFHSMEYTTFVKDAKAVGMSVATDSRARAKANQIGLGSAPVIHKGSGVNLTFDVKQAQNSNDQGILTVKSYTLDVADSVKSAWGNNSYNTQTINDNFLSQFGSKQGGKWVFEAKATEKLYINTNPAYIGPDKVNNIKYVEKSKASKEYQLTVRGGVLTHVDGTPITTIKTSNLALYEALEGMKLVGATKDATVLATFEHQVGKSLSEQKFRDLAKAARNNIDNLEIGKGWYSEDSTKTLIIREYTTVLSLPNTTFADKIPMTVSKGLETPINKQQFYSQMVTGHSIVRYSLKGGLVSESYFEQNTSQASRFGAKINSYGVPNVGITDTMNY